MGAGFVVVWLPRAAEIHERREHYAAGQLPPQVEEQRGAYLR
jgi:hypothetical protein